nr:hypothetical protein [uncultured Amphritea sp.]
MMIMTVVWLSPMPHLTGKPIRSMVYVLPEGFESDKNLTAWI